jgi:hypothetical protein
MKRALSRLASAATAIVALGLLAPTPASAEVRNCLGGSTEGTWTCKTTGGGIIHNGIPGLIELSGSGRHASAQIKGGSTVSATGSGSLTLRYYPSDLTMADAQITVELETRQPGCNSGRHASARDVLTSDMDGVFQDLAVPVACAGRVSYTVTVRAATTSPQGHFTGTVSLAVPGLA